jgi:hypothetical protein
MAENEEEKEEKQLTIEVRILNLAWWNLTLSPPDLSVDLLHYYY